MLIANTADQKFLEAILAELKKTNELLESLCPIAKDIKPKKEVKEVKPRTRKPTAKADKPKRGNTNAKIK